MDLRDAIETVDISFMAHSESTVNNEEAFVLRTDINHEKYMVSFLMKELLILIEFKHKIDLQSITLHALSATTEHNHDSDISAPKTIHFCHIDNLDITLEDIKKIKPTKTMHCTPEQLDKGQTIHLQKFVDIQYVAVYIASNQKDTESTYLNGITFNGQCNKKQIEPVTENKSASDDNKEDIVRNNVPCICGAELTEMVANDSSLSSTDDIACSQCGSYLKGVTKIYHCKNGSNNYHLKGYDLCQACADFEVKLKELYPNQHGPAQGIPLQYTGCGITPTANMITNNTYQPPTGTKKGVTCICGCKLTEMKAESTYANNKEASVQCDRCLVHLKGTDTVYHCTNESNMVHFNGYDLCQACADWMVGIQQMYLLQYGPPQGVPAQNTTIAQQANMMGMTGMAQQQNPNAFANQANIQSFPPANNVQSNFNQWGNPTQGFPMQNTMVVPQQNPFVNQLQPVPPIHDAQFEFDKSDNRTRKHLSEMLKSDDSDQKIESCRFDAGSLFDCNIIRFRSESCSFETCDSLKRLSTVLNKYHLYINTLQQDLLDTIYEGNYNNTALLNDFNHLLRSHDTQFEDIYDILIKNNSAESVCSLTKCVMVRRNRRNRAKEDKDLYFEQDEVNIYKQQLLDKIHSYYYHSFDTGYKLTREDRQKIINDDSKMDHDNEQEFDRTVTDLHVRRCGEIIRKRRAMYENIEELNENGTMSKKYNLDTNVLEYSYGIRYFYWKWYKNNLDINDYAHPAAGSADIDTQKPPNGAGVRLKEWYISPKYQNFKQELVSNAISVISLSNWRTLESKAKDYSQSNIVRQFSCPRTISALCFEMKYGDKMTMDHLIALMVYCNFGILAAKFTETFRRNKSETNQAMKERHRNFYYLGRLLRECVECFGMRNHWKQNGYKSDTLLVFHGINRQFMFESLNAFIKGPTSTTTDYAVALNFCGPEGMILQLSIRVTDWVLKFNEGELPTTRISCFDMQWISDFPNESEIFTFGGLNKFTFDTIIDASLSMNYKLYIKGLKQMCYQMSSGDLTATEPEAPLSKEEKVIVYRMLSHQLYAYAPGTDKAREFKSCPEYIQKIVRKHCESIESIMFESKSVQEKMQNAQHWALHDALFKYDNEWIKLDAVMKVFPNTKQITYSCDCHEKDVEFMKQPAIYNSILHFIQSNPKTKLINVSIDMALDLLHISAEMNTKMCQDVIFNIQHFMPEFFKFGWRIEAGVVGPVPPGTFKVHMMNLNV